MKNADIAWSAYDGRARQVKRCINGMEPEDHVSARAHGENGTETWGSSLLNGRQSVQHRLYHRCFTHRGIDHEVEEMPGWKLDSEVLPDEVRPVAIHGLHKLHRFFLALSGLFQAAHFFFERSIDENME